MKNLIKKILKENEDLGWALDATSDTNLPFTIGNPTQKPKIADIFRFKVSYMHGDADGYNTENFDVAASDMEMVINYITFFVNLSSNRYGNRGDMPRYRDWGNIDRLYYKIFGGDPEYTYDDMREMVISDHTSDHEYAAAVDGFDVFYFDNDGIEHVVNVKPEAVKMYTKSDLK